MNEKVSFNGIKVLDKKVVLEWKSGNDHKNLVSKDAPEPSFVQALNKLVPQLSHIFRIPENKREFVKVHGISVGGADERRFIVIKGRMETPSGKSVNLVSEAIMLEQDVYQFEEQIDELVEPIQEEARRFAFELKRAQKSLEEDPNFMAGQDDDLTV